MLERAIPTFRMTSSRASETFYTERLGFRVEFVHRPEGVTDDPCYIVIARDNVEIHLSSHAGDGEPGGIAVIIVESIEELHRELVLRATEIAVGPVDQTWGTREMYVRDPDENTLRFQQIR